MGEAKREAQPSLCSYKSSDVFVSSSSSPQADEKISLIIGGFV
jgi:hypothetical protein